MEVVSKAEKHLVLVHGACHGAWGWYKIIPTLEAGGHKVTALDMSASGVHKKHIDEVHTFHDYNLPLLEFMESLPPGEKVILVGHSLGGLNIAFATEKFPHKVSLSVFLGAIMPDTLHSPSYALDQDVVLAKMLVRPGSLYREDLAKQKLFTLDGFGSVKRVYIVLANHDLAVPEEFQYWQTENTGVSEKVIEDADHMAMLSSPHQVSQCLLEIASNYD